MLAGLNVLISAGGLSVVGIAWPHHLAVFATCTSSVGGSLDARSFVHPLF